MGYLNPVCGLLLSALSLVAKVPAESALATLEQRAGGRLGVMAIDTGSERTLAYRADTSFPLCSTFKLLLAAQILKKVEAGKETLTRILPYGPADLVVHAPITGPGVAAGGMAIGELCAAAVTYSDNPAANLLLDTLGGPKGLTAFARALGDPVTRLDRYEPALNAPAVGQQLDVTSPRAMAATLRKIMLGDLLSADSRDRLRGWLMASTTGARKLRAGLPGDWRIADKTGNGAEGATNDIAVVYPPGRPPIVVAAYYCGSKGAPAERDAVLAEVGRLVAETFSPH